MTRIFLVRHGATDAIDRMLSGRKPGIHLNATGQLQAEALGKFFKGHCILNRVLASPLERAQETAAAIARPQNLNVSTSLHLNEFDFGEWSGMSFEDLHNDPRWAEYNRYRSLMSAPGGESLLDVQRRAWTGIEELVGMHPDQALAVVSHADVIRALLMLFLGMPLDFILRFRVPLASVSEVEFGDNGPVVCCAGCTLPVR